MNDQIEHLRFDVHRLAAATHLNEVNPFMRPGIKIATSPTDYYPITKAQLVRYDKVHWVAVGTLLSAR